MGVVWCVVVQEIIARVLDVVFVGAGYLQSYQ